MPEALIYNRATGVGSGEEDLLTEAQQHVGYWWRPRARTSKQSGTLTLSADGEPRLALLGVLGSQKVFAAEVLNYDLIYGLTTGNKLFTLVDGRIAGTTLSAPFGTRQEIVARAALEGAHVPRRHLSFDRTTIEFDVLGEWFGLGRLERVQEDDSLQFNFRPGEPLTVQLDSSATLSIAVVEREAASQGEFVLKRVAQISITARQRLPLKRWLNHYVRSLRYFLSLAADRSAQVTGWSVSSPRVTVSMLDGSRRAVPVTVHSELRGSEPSKGSRRWGQLLFRADQVDVGQMLPRWMSLTEEIDAVLDLYFAVVDSPSVFVEWRFLSTVQALEVFHRRRYPAGKRTDGEHAARIGSILQDAPSAHRQWLEKELKYSNEPKLAERLRCLVDHVSGVVPEVIDEQFGKRSPSDSSVLGGLKIRKRSRDQFIRRIKDMRDHLTHYAKSQAASTSLGGELFWLQQRCGIVLRACLLLELGLSESQARALFLKNERYKFIANGQPSKVL